MNPIKISFLLTCPTLLLVAMGIAISGQAGLLVVFAVACGMSFFPSTYSDKIILKSAEPGDFRQRNIPPSVGCSVALSHQTETTLKESGQ